MKPTVKIVKKGGKRTWITSNKAIYQKVAYASGMSVANAKDAMRGIVKVICDELVAGKTVALVDFGKFFTKMRTGRTTNLINPKTKQPFTSVQPDKLYVKFIASKKLRAHMNQAKTKAQFKNENTH